jgi:hypothetical protein
MTPVLVASPANADVSGSTSGKDVVLFDRCIQHDIDYSLAIGPGTQLWNLHLDVLDPDGITAQLSDVSSTALSPVKGVVQVLFCGAEKPGRWSVVGVGFWEVVPGLQIPFNLPTSSFDVRPAATHTTLARTALGHGRYQLTVQVRDQRPHGFRRTQSAEVRLERLVDGSWKKIHGPELMTDHGRVTTKLAAGPGTKLRAVTAAEGNYGSSTSKPVRL